MKEILEWGKTKILLTGVDCDRQNQTEGNDRRGGTPNQREQDGLKRRQM